MSRFAPDDVVAARIAEETELDLARRARKAAGAYPLLAFLVMLGTRFRSEHQAVAITAMTLLVLAALVRSWLTSGFAERYARSPRSAVVPLRLVLVFSGVVWGAYAAAAAVLFGMSADFMLAMIFTAGIMGAATSTLRLARRTHVALLVTVVLPSMAVLAGHGASGWSLIAAMVVFMVFLVHDGMEAERTWQRNITDRIELDQAWRAAHEAERAKSEFLATMSHEIRTPLNGVIGLSAVLMREELTADQDRLAATIHGSATALLAIINDILDLSRIEAGALELEQRPFALRDCVEGVLDLFGERCWQQGIDLGYRFEEEAPSLVVGDASRLRQIVVNLVGNAVKFTAEGEVEVVVSRHAGSQVAIAVRDTGPGIAPEHQAVLFQRFRQVDASTTREHGGSGLGLAISQQLARAMDGFVDLDSTLGVGSTFRVVVDLPASPEAADEPSRFPGLAGKRVAVIATGAVIGRCLLDQCKEFGLQPELVAPRTVVGDVDAVVVVGNAPDPKALVTELGTTHPGRPLVLVAPAADHGLLRELAGAGLAGVVYWPPRLAQLGEVMACALGIRPAADCRRATDDGELARRCPLRILVVEDNVVNQIVMRASLKHMGYAAEVVSGADECLLATAQRSWDVVLMDVHMPGCDGLECTRRLRALGTDIAQPWVIGVSASTYPRDRERCVAAGMDDFMGKPFTLDELAAVLRRAAAARGLVADEGALPASSPAPQPVASGSVAECLAGLLAAFGGASDQVEALVATHISHSSTLLGRMREALAAADARALRLAAHSLKSSSAMFGGRDVSERCQAVERLAEAGQVEAVAELLPALAAALEHSHGQLQHHLTILLAAAPPRPVAAGDADSR